MIKRATNSTTDARLRPPTPAQPPPPPRTSANNTSSSLHSGRKGEQSYVDGLVQRCIYAERVATLTSSSRITKLVFVLVSLLRGSLYIRGAQHR